MSPAKLTENVLQSEGQTCKHTISFCMYVWLQIRDLPLCRGPELTAAMLCEGGSCALKYARSFSLEIPERSGCTMSVLDVVRPTRKETCALLRHLHSWTFLSSALHSTESQRHFYHCRMDLCSDSFAGAKRGNQLMPGSEDRTVAC